MNRRMKTRIKTLGFGAVSVAFALLSAYWAASLMLGETGIDEPLILEPFATGFAVLSLAGAGSFAVLGAGAFVPSLWARAKAFSLVVLGIGLLSSVAARFALWHADGIYLFLGYCAGAMNVVLSCFIISACVIKRESARWSDGAAGGAFRFVHAAAIIHVAVAVLSLQPEAIKVQWFAELATTLIWAETAAALALLAVLNRRRYSRFGIAGAAASGFAFAGVWLHAPTMYAVPIPDGLGWRLSGPGWVAALMVSIPALAFLALFLRRAAIFGGFPRLPRIIAAAVFAALVCAGAVQTISAPRYELSRGMSAALSAGGGEIRLSELTDFEWDAVEIYASPSDKNLTPTGRGGVNLLDRLMHGAGEESGMFVFAKGGKAIYRKALLSEIAYIEYRYNLSDSSRPDFVNPIILKRADAAFAPEYAYGAESAPTLAVKDAAALMR